ncbi:MAG: histidine phosphatase family protein [Ruminococcaceae bacterium]|nr:histidine phosphatase family protein [Oscillospiraceae bacterium]
MLFFYIRHGDPIYDPDSLTPLGMRQAESVGRRLSQFGIDRIYSSTSNRAIQTATPLCELLHKELHTLDWANEGHAWRDLTIEREGFRTWLFQDTYARSVFTTKEMRDLGDNWYDHPAFKDMNYKKGIERIYGEVYNFFKSHGYEQERGTGRFKVLDHNEDRIAMFAHQGFGIAFLSCILEIPYPLFASHFDICHTGVTVIEFCDEGGYAIPHVQTVSNNGHMYKDGLPLKFNGRGVSDLGKTVILHERNRF